MVVMASTTFFHARGDPTRKAMLLGLCTLWGLRLGGHLLWRWRNRGSDRRYQAMLAKAQETRHWSFAKASLLLVFVTQAPLLFIVCLPVRLGQMNRAPSVGALGFRRRRASRDRHRV